MQEVVQLIVHNAVEALLLALVTLATMAINKARAYFKAKTTERQYETMVKISKDVYDYVEREFGDKLKEKGSDKLGRAFQVFDTQMKQHKLPYSSADFKLQVEKIIREEKMKG